MPGPMTRKYEYVILLYQKKEKKTSAECHILLIVYTSALIRRQAI
jgi:hypothetical protein